MKERNKRRKSRNYWNNSEGKKKPKLRGERAEIIEIIVRERKSQNF